MILIDPPVWPGWNRVWSHLVSDEAYDELVLARAIRRLHVVVQAMQLRAQTRQRDRRAVDLDLVRHRLAPGHQRHIELRAQIIERGHAAGCDHGGVGPAADIAEQLKARAGHRAHAVASPVGGSAPGQGLTGRARGGTSGTAPGAAVRRKVVLRARTMVRLLTHPSDSVRI